MKVLVTGGAGFIGSNLVDKLINEGHKVVVLDNLCTGKFKNLNKKVKFYNINVCNPKIKDIFKTEQIDVVYHQAAQIDVQKSISDPVLDGDVNILGSINILEACKKSSVKKIIYASSAAVYGEPQFLGIDEKHPINPISYYGISKYTPENYIKTYSNLYGLDYTILRYANVYGIRQAPKGEGGVISIFMGKFLRHESPIIYGDGSAKRDFIYVEDIVNANVRALDRGSREVFNIGTGKATSIKELFNKMREITESDIEVKYGDERKGDIKTSYFNTTKANEILGWTPQYTLEEGISKTLRYYFSAISNKTVVEAAVAKEEEDM